MQNIQESVNLALVEDNGIVGNSSIAYHGRSASIVGSRYEKRADRVRYWHAVLISMIVVPMLVVLGFYAAVPAQAAGPAPIVLGGAGNFVILSESGISATGTTAITGNIGVSPIDAGSITGFDLIYNSGDEYATSALVTGNVYTPDYAAPTPDMLTTAVGDMMTAFTTAKGLPTDHLTELYAGDLTGQTLDPGVYNWGTNVDVYDAGVYISGAAGDVWVFQIAQDLTLASGANVYLIGGALPENIFWAVTGQVTIDTGAQMKGIILCATAIVLNTGATLEGRALAQTAVTLDANFVGVPGTPMPIPEFSQVLIPLVGMVFVVAIVSKVRNQRK